MLVDPNDSVRLAQKERRTQKVLEEGTMKRIAYLLIAAAGLCLPAWAANSIEPVTVAQLTQFITAAQGQSDGKVAKQLETMVLTERATTAQLAQWQAALPGQHSRDNLTVIGDASMLLMPPAADMPSDQAPDGQTQNAILARASTYLTQTLAKVPDFTATRVMEHFEDTPAREGSEHIFTSGTIGSSMAGVGTAAGGRQSYLGGGIAAQAVHFTGKTTAPITFTGGIETVGTDKIDLAAINQPESGLVTAGEFGPILATVLKDMANGDVEWGYWLATPQGKLAVMTYKVPDDQSTYTVTYKHGSHQERLFPAYHGEIAIDPATGAVLHLTVVANSLRSQTIMGSALTIDYAPVALGGTNYICPVRGVASLKISTNSGESQTQINDVAFTDYHAIGGPIAQK